MRSSLLHVRLPVRSGGIAFHLHHRRAAMGQLGQHPVIDARRSLPSSKPRWSRRAGSGFGLHRATRTFLHPAVGDQRAVRGVQLALGRWAWARSAGAAADAPVRAPGLRVVQVVLAHRGLADGAGEDAWPVRAGPRPPPPAGRSGTGRDTAARPAAGSAAPRSPAGCAAAAGRPSPARACGRRADRMAVQAGLAWHQDGCGACSLCRGLGIASHPGLVLRLFLVTIADAVQRLHLVEIVVERCGISCGCAFTWLSMVRSST